MIWTPNNEIRCSLRNYIISLLGGGGGKDDHLCVRLLYVLCLCSLMTRFCCKPPESLFCICFRPPSTSLVSSHVPCVPTFAHVSPCFSRLSRFPAPPPAVFHRPRPWRWPAPRRRTSRRPTRGARRRPTRDSEGSTCFRFPKKENPCFGLLAASTFFSSFGFRAIAREICVCRSNLLKADGQIPWSTS